MVATLVQFLGLACLLVGAAMAFGAGGFLMACGLSALLVGEALER